MFIQIILTNRRIAFCGWNSHFFYTELGGTVHIITALLYGIMLDLSTCCWLTVVLFCFSQLSVLPHDRWFVDLPWALRILRKARRSWKQPSSLPHYSDFHVTVPDHWLAPACRLCSNPNKSKIFFFTAHLATLGHIGCCWRSFVKHKWGGARICPLMCT